MRDLSPKQQRSRMVAGAVACTFAFMLPAAAQEAAPADTATTAEDTNTPTGNTADNTPQATEHDTALDSAVMSSLSYCQAHYSSCAAATKSAAGVLVFPSVVKADVIIGGAGGKGALVENGRITGYYSIGIASVGLQAGVENASEVYTFPSEDAMKSLKEDKGSWRVSDTADVTVMSANADASSATGKTAVFIFDSHGLHAGVSLDLVDVWKTGATRPERTAQ